MAIYKTSWCSASRTFIIFPTNMYHFYKLKKKKLLIKLSACPGIILVHISFYLFSFSHHILSKGFNYFLYGNDYKSIFPFRYFFSSHKYLYFLLEIHPFMEIYVLTAYYMPGAMITDRNTVAKAK